MRRTALALGAAIAFTQFAVNAIAYAEEPPQTIQSLLEEARAAQSRGEFSAASEAYRRAVALDPSVAELWANLGLMDHESGRHEEAIRSFKEAVKLNPALFVPQLFLGIEYLGFKKPETAIPFLEKAEKLNPDDPQAALNLGKAYAMMDRSDRAAAAYLRVIRLAPNNGNAWLSLGMAYLQQVEDDARLMTSTYSHSPYVGLRTAETFADEGKLVDAENAYRAVVASSPAALCAHAEFGITLLRAKKSAEAHEQFETESRSESHCGLSSLGVAVAAASDGHPDEAVEDLASIAMADPGFVQSSLHLFRGALPDDQAKVLADLARSRQSAGDLSVDLGSIIEQTLLSETVSGQGVDESRTPELTSEAPPSEAERLYAAGKYAACDRALKPALEKLDRAQQQLLASCSFYTGDFATTTMAAERQKEDPVTMVQGLYWETKADQKLAIAALNRAGEIDADSSRMHVLLGDIFRQKRRWDEAEMEYRKAVDLDPKSHAARLSLAIVLFTELKTDEALGIDRRLLSENSGDPQANLLAAEILVQRALYAEAEPYLSKCHSLEPEFVPHLHALLGQVYAETGRIPAAISEYKAGLSTDEDGSIHYQLARLYQKSGDKVAAEEAFKASKRLRSHWDERAHIALEQNSTDLSHQ
jgi:tetratricopeptide (TPR) repeat protein